MEDDISATITLPANQLNNLNPEYSNKSVKLVTNCESYLFQRPDEAIIRGYDKDSEADIVTNNTFLTNYEPLTKKDAIEICEDAINFDQYTEPVQKLINRVVESDKDCYFVAPSHTRIVDGTPTNNPRYLQTSRQRRASTGRHCSRYLGKPPGPPDSGTTRKAHLRHSRGRPSGRRS